jgi:hypothetical protein
MSMIKSLTAIQLTDLATKTIILGNIQNGRRFSGAFEFLCVNLAYRFSRNSARRFPIHPPFGSNLVIYSCDVLGQIYAHRQTIQLFQGPVVPEACSSLRIRFVVACEFVLVHGKAADFIVGEKLHQGMSDAVLNRQYHH